MRPDGSRFASRTLQLHRKAASERLTRPRDMDDTGGACGRRTPLGLAARKPFVQVINEVSCSAMMKPRETVLQSSTLLSPLALCRRRHSKLRSSIRLPTCWPRASGRLGLQMVEWTRPCAVTVGGARLRAAATRFNARYP